MKKQFLTAALVILGLAQANAQESSLLDKVSLEASYGVAMPLSPTENVTASDYTSFTNFQGGINYQINDIWGVRATYAYQQFENKDFDKLGVQYHKFMAEATYNVLQAINPSTSALQENPFEVVAHAGIGGSFAFREINNKSNKMGNAQIGLKPTYAVSSRINIFLDATYIMNFNQAYDVSGKSINGGTTGSYLAGNIGLQVKLGN